MARLSNDLEVSKIMGITEEAKKIIQGTSWIVTGAKQNFEYEDVKDANGKVIRKDQTDTVKNTTFLLVGPQDPKADKLVRLKQFQVKTEEAFTKAQCDYFNDEQPSVKIVIDRCTPWISQSSNGYNRIALSIYVRIFDDVNAAEITSDNLNVD